MSTLDQIAQNYINGNLSDAKQMAKRVSLLSLIHKFRVYGKSYECAEAIATYLKGNGTFQAACDAENTNLRLNKDWYPGQRTFCP